MQNKFGTILGYAWAFPVTLPGIIYASFFQLLGWHNWIGLKGDALVWVINPQKSPQFLLNLWKGWGGHTIGNVVVLRSPPDEKAVILVHEQKHVDQCMRLGIFQPIMYGLNMLAIKVGCPGSDPYYSNPFEVDARRAAGQIIDIEGATKRALEGKK